jgi:tetratricopeptide (TPR) repeat protein
VSRSVRSVDLEGAFDGCPIPTLLLEGKWDMTWNTDKPEKLQLNHPRARLVLFEASAHDPFEDEPDRFFQELEGFVRKLPAVPDKDLSAWKDLVAGRKESPASIVKNAGWGRKSNAKTASLFAEAWLERIEDPSLLLKTGFALYDVKRYPEALSVFRKMEERARGQALLESVALVWQGHMLDLLEKRSDAISVYRKAATMDAGRLMRHDQFGLAYRPSEYAKERIETPFVRVENRQED